MKICPKCNTEHYKQGKFCSRSCANSRTWSEEDKHKKRIAALGNEPWNKGKKTGPRRTETLTKIKESHFKKTRARFLAGLVTERKTIRKQLEQVCAECGINDFYNNKPLTLQVDHIDGNAGNNMPDNIRLLCPNCHSQQDNWGAKNKGNGRAARGLPLR